MPIPEEFVKKRNEVTISRASLKLLSCAKCGAAIDSSHVKGGYAKCEYCGHVYTLDAPAST